MANDEDVLKSAEDSVTSCDVQLQKLIDEIPDGEQSSYELIAMFLEQRSPQLIAAVHAYCELHRAKEMVGRIVFDLGKQIARPITHG